MPDLVIITSNGFLAPQHVRGRALAHTPPGAKLEAIEMLSKTRARITYRHHGVRTPTFLEISL